MLRRETERKTALAIQKIIPQEMATVGKAVQGVDSKKARTVKFPVLAFYNEF